MLQASKVVIFGTSGHAQVIVDIIESDPKFELIGFIDNLIPVGEKILDNSLDKTKTAALTMVTNTLLNHDETYTKR